MYACECYFGNKIRGYVLSDIKNTPLILIGIQEIFDNIHVKT